MTSPGPPQDTVAARRGGLTRPPAGGELADVAVRVALFVAGAVGLAVSGWSDTPLHPFVAVALVCCYAGATLVPIETGRGVTDATMLVLVPMLFALPAALVAPCCALGLVIGRIPDYADGAIHPRRAPFCLANSLHALGPAAVLALGVHGGPRWSDSGWYLLAFAAYLLGDALSALISDSLAAGQRPRIDFVALADVYRLDLLLAPLGLLAALATEQAPYAFLLAAPLLVVLGREARERSARIDGALALSESQRALLQSELDAARAREEVLATVSHGLQLPVATIVGLASLLHERGDEITAARRIQANAHLHAEAIGLRQVVRMSLDFVALKSGQQLRVDMGEVEMDAVAAGLEHVELRQPGVVVCADGARLRQVLLALAQLSRAHGGPGAVVDADGATVTLRAIVPDGSSALEPEREAADVDVASALVAAMGGQLTRRPIAGGHELHAQLAGVAVPVAG